MKTEFRELRLHQLTQALVPFRDAESAVRPSRGWLRAIRESLGLTLEQVGRAMDRTRQDTLAFERSEAEDRITLKSLRRVAAAMGCTEPRLKSSPTREYRCCAFPLRGAPRWSRVHSQKW